MPSRIAAAFILSVLLSSTISVSPSTPRDSIRKATVGKAIYFITNDDDNAVIALSINLDGTLSRGTITSTGGAGSNVLAVGGMTTQAPDALVAQSSLAIVDNNIFAVNAGSNTLSLMEISAKSPSALKIVGEPATLPGEFPNTVAVSKKNKLACVAMTGAKAGISCASFSTKGLGLMDNLRPFDLNQSTPPIGKFNTVSQTFFSTDESKLYTTVKGNPATNNTGFFSVFTVDHTNQLSAEDVRSSPNGTQILFGSTPIPDSPNHVFVTDRAFGAIVLFVDPETAKVDLVGKGIIEGQIATCWAAVSHITHSAFVTDGSIDRIVEMSLDNASVISKLDLFSNGDPGLIDLAVAGDFIYALSPGNDTDQAAVTVLDISGGQGSARQIQHFQLGDLGVNKNAQGMVALS
ncbi:hypothetical protein AOQ84DRAFT_221484 [Glonium stellatum]|uniref:Uncharacterized protein n=1 Tax=Glonium stellatum TaxID=574774 RepID=A0A8E2F1I7_9PEZI|nr:hypothetical protein AOQ84DRAFT_221484 [Glonium stellatum]